jgi:hypothetical protein
MTYGVAFSSSLKDFARDAIAAFAGVRWNEIEQLNWEEITEN